MKRYVQKGGETINTKLTDAMIEEANAIVTKDMSGRRSPEDKERECHIWGGHWMGCFSIECRTSFDYRSYIFRLQEDGTIKFIQVEGDFRD